jgi:hypothetical protein
MLRSGRCKRKVTEIHSIVHSSRRKDAPVHPKSVTLRGLTQPVRALDLNVQVRCKGVLASDSLCSTTVHLKYQLAPKVAVIVRFTATAASAHVL